MRVILRLVWCVVFWSALSAWCEEPPPWAGERGRVSARELQVTTVPAAPEALSLEDALRLGFANNAGFRSSIASLLDTQADLRVTQQLYAITVSGSTRTTDPGENGTITRTSLATDLDYDLLTGASISVSALLDRLDSEQSSALSLAVTQPLLRGAGRSSARYEALRSGYTAYRRALLQFFLNRQDLALDIIRSYFGVVRAQDQVAIEEQGLMQADRAVKYAEDRLKEGMTTRIEVARAQLSQASRRLSLSRVRRSVQDEMDTFLQTLGLQVGAGPALTTRVVYRPVTLETEALVSEALAKRAEVRIRELVLEDTRAAVRLSRNRRRPSLDLFGETVRPLEGDGNATEWTLGVQTSIPIGSRRLGEAVRQAERSWLVAQRGYTELTQNVSTQVRREVHALESQQANLDILRQTLEVAREKLRLAAISVEEGVGVDRDKIEAQDEVTNAERDLVDAETDYYFGVLDLRRAVGRDVLEGLAGETKPAEPSKAAPGSEESGAPAGKGGQ